jgi:Gram-negative bacterial TonB protein C-terminal
MARIFLALFAAAGAQQDAPAVTRDIDPQEVGAAASDPPQQPSARTASTPWQVDYGDDRCSALRRFGEGDDGIFFELSRSASFDLLDVSIYGRAVPRMSPTPTLRVALNGTEVEGAFASESWILPGRAGRAATVRFAVANIAPQLLASRTISIIANERHRFDFEMAQLAGVLRHLDRCHESLLQNWGVDPAAQRQLLMPPSPISFERWLESDSFPPFTGRASAAILLRISATGAIEDCRVIDTSGSSEVDDRVCPLIRRRARLNPAIGSDGQPVAAHFIQRIRFSG